MEGTLRRKSEPPGHLGRRISGAGIRTQRRRITRKIRFCRCTASVNSTKKKVQTHPIKGADAGELEPESSRIQASVTCANLGTPVLRCRGQGERETDLGKASRTPANNSGKCNLAVMQEVNDPYGSDGSRETQRKVASEVATIDAGIGVEPDGPDGEHNLTRQLADMPSPINSRSPLTPNVLGCSCGMRYSDSQDLNNYYIGELKKKTRVR